MMKSSMIFFGKCRRIMAVVMLAGACLLAGCSKDEGVQDPDKPEQPEKPAEATLTLSVKDLAFEAAGGWKEFTINSSAAWTITGGNAWCQPGATSGSGKTQVKIMVEAYTGTSDRNVVLTVKSGSLTATLTVTQKAVQALTLTKDKFDLPQEGGDITVEVKSNIEYTVTIPTAYRAWITEAPQSKAMVTKSFRFKIAANEETEKREGYIVISGNSLKDTVYVYQAEGRTLVLSESTLELTADKQEVEVELRTNVDYDIEIPDTVSGWISLLPETKAARSDKLRLLIAENEQTEERQAVVIVKDKNSELADTLHIKQLQANALSLGQKEFNVSSEGETLIVELKTNIEYQVVIPDTVSGWVSILPETKALRTDKLQFLIGKNEQTKERQAVVIVKTQNSKLSDTLHIRQFQASALILGQKEFNVPSEGETLIVELKTNIEYQVVIPDTVSGWVSILPETEALHPDKLQLLVGTNEQPDDRQAVIIIQDKNSELADTLYIKQFQVNALILGQKEFDVKSKGETLSVELKTNVEYQVIIPDTVSGWISRLPETRALRTDKLQLLIGANEQTKERLAAVIIRDKNSELADTLRIRQAEKSDTLYLTGVPIKHIEYQENATAGITFSVSTPWKMVISYEGETTDWLSIPKTSGEEGYYDMIVTALTENPYSTTRKVYIDIIYGSKVKRLTFIQYANGGIDITDKFDPGFAKVLQEKGYIQDATHITIKDIDKIRTLEIPNSQLTSLQGIEYFTILNELNCSNNQLSTLDLSKISLGWELNCSNNNLTYLNIENCSISYQLDCSGNKLTSLDISNCTHLEYLYCNNNQLSTLDINNCTQLKNVDCSDNQLTTLDVSTRTPLVFRYICRNNPGMKGIFLVLTNYTEGISTTTWTYEGQTVTLEYVNVNPGSSPYLQLDTKELSLKTIIGGESTVSIKTNVEYDVVIPPDASYWVQCTAKNIRYLYFNIARNNELHSRQAKIVIKNKTYGLWDTLHITQIAQNVLTSNQRALQVENKGGNFSIPLISNVAYNVIIPSEAQNWIKHTGGSAEELLFSIAANEQPTTRSADITIQSQNRQLSFVLNVIQYQAANEIHVSVPGQLCDMVSKIKDEVTVLKITGKLDYTDYACLREMPKLESLDLSGLDDSSMPEGALENCQLVNLKLPLNLVKIPSRAFYNCTNLKGDLILPTNVTSIGARAFYNCANLRGVLVIPSKVTSIGTAAFYYCTGLTGELVIPERVTTIGTDAFSHCTGFTGLVLPKNLTSINDRVFEECTGFTGELVIPENMTSIGQYAFANCKKFYGALVIPDRVTSIGNYAFLDCSGFTGLTLPSRIKSIGKGIFGNCSGFTGKLTIPEGVTSIDTMAFYKCSGFSGLSIPQSMKTIKHAAFYSCQGFRSKLIIPDQVTNVEEYAFYECSGFSDLVLGKGLTEIQKCTFKNCKGFRKLELPNNITKIYESAFESCKGLSGDLVIHDEMTYIGKYAFALCTGYQYYSLILGKSIKTIGDAAFQGSYYGKIFNKVYCKAEEPPTIGYNAFCDTYYSNNLCKELYVIRGKKIKYDASTWIRYFQNILEADF